MILKEHKIGQKAIIGLTLVIVALSFVSYVFGAILSSTTETIALTTSTQISVTSVFSSSTVTMTSYVMKTTSTLVTVTDTGPDTVLLQGKAKSNQVGTFATDVIFVSASNNQTRFDAKITDGQYSQQLPAHIYYNVFIKFGTSLSNVGSGQCSAGALGTWFGNAIPSLDWAC